MNRFIGQTIARNSKIATNGLSSNAIERFNMKSDIKEFIGLLFLSRDFAHKAHLNSNSYAEHVALGDFYTGVVELADSLAEAWMGRNLKKIGEIPSLSSPKGDPLDVLKRHLDVLMDARSFVDSKDTALNNIVDEIESLYLSTIYKLKFLK